MGRVNLKELKDALNKLPDENLKHFFISHKMSLEDPEVELGCVFFDEEENFKKHMALFDRPEFEVINRFVKAIEEDCKKVCICILDEDKAELYADDCE